MNIKDFEKRLNIVKQDFKTIEEKSKDFVNGLSPFIDDATGIAAPWMYGIVKQEFKNLIYAVDPEKLLDYRDNQKTVDSDIDTFIDYYIFEANFGGYIEWEDENGKHVYNLDKDEDVLKYIEEGIVA